MTLDCLFRTQHPLTSGMFCAMSVLKRPDLGINAAQSSRASVRTCGEECMSHQAPVKASFP